jgi:hypothetical protein
MLGGNDYGRWHCFVERALNLSPLTVAPARVASAMFEGEWTTTTQTGRLGMSDAAADRLEDLREEARYRRERLDLYRARLYGGRAHSQDKLRELERASDGAAARLRRAEEQAAAKRSSA